MDSRFRELLEALEPKYRVLIGMAPSTYAALPRSLPERAIYLFSEPGAHLYVGRTNRLRARLRGHCIPCATQFTATFAFKIARLTTGHPKATYARQGSRAELVTEPAFAAAFAEAKRRVASMEIRFVEEVGATRQSLLEIYAATVLRTPYNDFDNH